MEWSLLSLWAMGLYASMELTQQAIPLERLSFAGTLSAFRNMARDYLHAADRKQTLRILLRKSLLDTYERNSKSSRDYPRKKKHKTPGPPDIQTATPEQRKQAKHLLKYP